MASSESERRSRVSVAVKVKTSSDGEVRRFRLEEEDNKDLFDTLVSRIRSLLGSERSGRVSYVDGDGDVVVMESTEEVLEAIRLSPSVLTILWRDDEIGREKGGQVTHPHPSCSSSSYSSSSFASSSSYNPQGYVDSHQMHQQLMTSSSDDDDDDSDNSEKEESGGKGNAKEMERFEKKKAKIEAKMAKLREKEKDERGEKKMAKLQRKLDLLEKMRENPKKRKGVKESDSNVSMKISLENQLSRVQKKKTKNDKKIHKFREQLKELYEAPNKGTQVDRLREKLADLEDRQNCLIAQEREVERQLQPFALAV